MVGYRPFEVSLLYRNSYSFQRFQHCTCKASPKLPVLPTNPAGPFPSAQAAGTGMDG